MVTKVLTPAQPGGRQSWSGQEAMSCLWQQDQTAFPPGVEIDSSSMRAKSRESSHSWMKQETDAQLIHWKTVVPGAGSDAEQDNTPTSAVSTVTPMDGLPTSAVLTITKLQCLLERKQEKIEALERQVEDLQQDRKFLRAQIENLTSMRRVPAAEGGQSVHCEPKAHKRQGPASLSHSPGGESVSDGSLSSATTAASADIKKKRHHKERRRGKEGKDYSRKRATGVQYVIHRYKQVLSAYNKKKSMSGAFRHYGIDRNTIANTAPIAELHLAAKETVALVGQFRPREETLVSYAQRCALAIEADEALTRRIEQMKADGELLPIAAKRARVHSLLGH
ncbi:coiled-coil domain-containing protein 106-like isoform X1 [Electrophorus electricus]|uniref:coiled-coil domain-containing protein 106-like isoform X1 n=2 Tax=Electrophorus electricus TaxID=8005 RepID=UPI0015D056F8|nr:coiled-coil domain-containing protein 106-like isoform X1 [Electrophorus electricus]